MFRILLIVILLFYLLYKLGLFRVFVSSVNDGYREQGNSNRRPPGSNVDIDETPPEGKPKNKFKGGEYVDYEEIK
jgi:hypothetical protein